MPIYAQMVCISLSLSHSSHRLAYTRGTHSWGMCWRSSSKKTTTIFKSKQVHRLFLICKMHSTQKRYMYTQWCAILSFHVTHFVFSIIQWNEINNVWMCALQKQCSFSCFYCYGGCILHKHEIFAVSIENGVMPDCGRFDWNWCFYARAELKLR